MFHGTRRFPGSILQQGQGHLSLGVASVVYFDLWGGRGVQGQHGPKYGGSGDGGGQNHVEQ